MTCVEKILSLGRELERGCNDVDNAILKILSRISNAHIHLQKTATTLARGEEKEGSVGDMSRNIFTDTVYSLFTTHYSLIFNDMDFSRFTSHFSLKHKKNLFSIMLRDSFLLIIRYFL